MNTRIVMTASAMALGATGIALTFASDLVLRHFGVEVNDIVLLISQALGALYFGFGMMNWMNKSTLIGGIYNRPLAIGNFTHFMIAGLALLKTLASNQNLPLTIWTVGFVYAVFAILFGIILFRHPIGDNQET